MKTKATQQITEITFPEDMNPFVSKYLAEKACLVIVLSTLCSCATEFVERIVVEVILC